MVEQFTETVSEVKHIVSDTLIKQKAIYFKLSSEELPLHLTIQLLNSKCNYLTKQTFAYTLYLI